MIALAVLLPLLAGAGTRLSPWQRVVVTSDSMAPTLVRGDVVWMDVRAAGGRGVGRGDIVVFTEPDTWSDPAGRGDGRREGEAQVVKRVIALGGEVVACCGPDGRLIVDGSPLAEDYLAPGTRGSTVAFEVAVPPGHLWLMGDHREISRDSRQHELGPGHGWVPRDAVLGRLGGDR